jgi:hypothetical protein
MLMPMTSIVKQLNMEMQVKVIEVKNNVELDDAMFEKPKVEAEESLKPMPIRVRDK